MDFQFNFQFDEAGEAAVADARPPSGTAPPAAVHVDPLTPLELVAADLSALTHDLEAVAVSEELPGLRRLLVTDPDAITGFHRDVVLGSYEGGARVWECTMDLLQYMRTHPELCRDACVLDLGCGAGLLGCYALQQGARAVALQDLNASVLQHIAAHNVAINAAGTGSSPAPVTLLAGCWASMAQACSGSDTDSDSGSARSSGGSLTAVAAVSAMDTTSGDAPSASSPPSAAAAAALRRMAGHVDFLLSAETLYLPSRYPVLIALLHALLHPTRGAALFATKRYYFGEELGGGSSEFVAACNAAGAGAGAGGGGGRGLKAVVVGSIEDGASMIRDIIRVTRQ